MFTFTGLTRPQCERLTSKHHVFLTMVGGGWVVRDGVWWCMVCSRVVQGGKNMCGIYGVSRT